MTTDDPLEYAYETGYNDALALSDLQGLRAENDQLRARLHGDEQTILAQQAEIARLTAELEQARAALRVYVDTYGWTPSAANVLLVPPAGVEDTAVNIPLASGRERGYEVDDPAANFEQWAAAHGFDLGTIDGRDRAVAAYGDTAGRF